MTDRDYRPNNAEIRKRAEELAQQETSPFPKDVEALPPQEIRQAFHELRVHQIQLEMQNEELRRAQSELAATRARYFDLYELAPVGYLIISEKGIIQEANLTLATLLGVARSALVNQPITRFIHKPDQDIYYLHRRRLFGTGEPQVCEIQMVRKDGAPFWMRMEAVTATAPDGTLVSRVALGDITERKRAEDALREQLDFSESLIETAQTIILVLDPQGRIVRFNRYMEKLTGYNLDEVKGKDWFETFIKPENGNTVKSVFQRTVDDIQTSGTVNPIITKDGRTILVEWNNKTLKDKDGSTVGVLAIGQDITERKAAEAEQQRLLEQVERDRRALLSTLEDQRRTEETLRESEARFRRAVTGAPFPIMIHAEDGQVVTINTPWTRLTGYEHSDIPTIADWTRKAYGTQMDPVRADIDGLYALDGPKAEDEYAITTSSGDSRIWDFSSAPIGQLPDGRRLVISMAMDVTERKRAEAALRAERELLRTLIDSMPDYIYAKDAQGRFTVANVAVAQGMGGTTPEGLVGKTDAGFYPPELAAQYRADEEQVLRSGQALLNREEQVITAAGEWRWLLSSKVPLRDHVGEVVGLVGTGRDITEHKQLEAQLRQAQKMEAVGQLAGGVAHDFNNMLSAIIGYAEFALAQLDASDPVHADVRIICEAAQRSANLTRQLLAFARRQVIAPRVLDLNETIESLLKMLRRLIGEDIDLAWLPCGRLWPVMMDPGQVDQILANLCVNARDAIGGVGKMTIETGHAVLDRAYCDAHAEAIPGEYVLLAVSDDGHGMDQETMGRLFEPFFTTKPVGQGTGLGLATVYGIVKQNNGHINVYSEPGKGTTFRIYLPRHVDVSQAEEEARPEAATAPRRGHETILLVEDEPTVLGVGTRILEGAGYTVLAAGSPGEALRLAGEHNGEIHLLITDVVMPEMSGKELAERLSAGRPAIKCLFMSGYTANVIAHQGVLDEGVEFVQKPFTNDQLAAKVRQVLD